MHGDPSSRKNVRLLLQAGERCSSACSGLQGVSGKALDGRGNYTLGVKEHIIFPEIDYDKIDKIKGLNISIITTAKTDEEGKELLKLLGMPFRS